MAGLRDGVVIAVLSLTASAWASAQEEQPVPADPLADLIVAVEKDQAEDDIAPDEGNGASETDGHSRNKNEADGETTETEAVAEDFATPPLWKVSDDDSDVYLLGTFHILPADLKWRNATITEIIKSADTFYFEVEGDAPSAQMRTTHILMTEGFNPPGEML
ncbi:MAG: TraB/GumN family protein, partial [Pseudomonadota bacterium]